MKSKTNRHKTNKTNANKSKTKRQKTNRTKYITNISKTKEKKNKLACLKKLVADKFFSRKIEL